VTSLYSPGILLSIEREGVTEQSGELLLTLSLLVFAGGTVGALAGRARAQARDHEALTSIQRLVVGATAPIPFLLRAADVITRHLGARDAALYLVGPPPLLVVAEGERPAVLHPVGVLPPASVLQWVSRQGARVESRNLVRDPRFGRSRPAEATALAALSLGTGGPPVGALAVERAERFRAADLSVLDTLAGQLTLGLENLRLLERQQQFAEELGMKVEAATRTLRDLDQAKSDFISVVSHELRTPLTAIQGFSELLLTRGLDEARRSQFLGIIHREAERIGRLVSDLLDLSRIEMGRGLDLDPIPLDPIPLLEANLALFASQSPNHRFELAILSPLPPVLADRDRLDQIIKNLLSNAVKYSPQGGRVRVEARPGPRGTASISVTDEGIGIPALALPRIFDKYYRVEGVQTRSVRGLGIGLAMVKYLVESHGGSIEAQSREGEGSCFTVALPAATGSAVHAEVEPSRNP
jgi:signal transduction histidine kinase